MKAKKTTTKKRSTKKTSIKRPKTKIRNIVPVVEDIAVIEPMYESPAPLIAEKTLSQPPSKLKLWIGVIVTMIIIVVAWGYSLQFTLGNSGAALQDSVKKTKFDNLFTNIQQGFDDLQDSANQVTTVTTNTTITNTNTVDNSNQDLNNLFSDIH